MHAVKIPFMCVLLGLVPATHAVSLRDALTKYKKELKTTACITGGVAAWIASSYMIHLLKDPATAYKTCKANYHCLKKQIRKQLGTADNDKQSYDCLQKLLLSLEETQEETIAAFDRLIVLHSLFDTETQERARQRLLDKMWHITGKLGTYHATGALTGNYHSPEQFDGKRDISYESFLLRDSIISAWLLEPPALIITALYNKLFPNEQAALENKNRCARSFIYSTTQQTNYSYHCT
jgi:hypothetical protein